jgi:sugar/nucleoside kinase (ribokinase family)
MNFHRTSPADGPHILCIGMPVRDMIFRVNDLPARGMKKPATHFSELSGGNALNAGVAITRLGGHVTMSGPMGDAGEKASAYILDDLAKEGIDGSGIVRMPGLVTPISNIMIDPGGERTIVTYRDPALWKVKMPDADTLLNDCDALLTENRCAEFVTDICVEARKRGIPVVLDADHIMSLREGLLVTSSHIIFSSEALHATSGLDDDTESLRKIADLTPSFLAVTNGAQGITWLDSQRQPQLIPSFPVHTVDTLGAGDVFHGAFALAVAEGQELKEAMRFASAAAALKCTRFGGAFASPQRSEVETFLVQNPALSPA